MRNKKCYKLFGSKIIVDITYNVVENEALNRNHPIITLLTDFGSKDAYVSALKGVILSICPETKIIDIAHDIPKYDINYGAFLLSQTAPYFPVGTIHLVVIDPGVGTTRRRIIINGKRNMYVGPDNGVLSLAAEKEGVIKTVEIKKKQFMLHIVSKTFEGRDVFAPVSAYLAKGYKIDAFGPIIRNIVKLPLANIEIVNGKLVGEILYIDGFGNIITNIVNKSIHCSEIPVGAPFTVSIGEQSKKMTLCSAYEEVSVGKPLMIIGSSGFYEISVNKGSAKVLFQANIGDVIEISVP